ncbi:MAG: hypothetical protein JWR32_1579 [Mycobacterium sp.]|jgi:hypothetical protein|nr:hypothetical protein [Mycobacterium sp.]
MSTWRCGWICPRSYFFAAVFLVGASFAVLLVGAFLGGLVTLHIPAMRRWGQPEGRRDVKTRSVRKAGDGGEDAELALDVTPGRLVHKLSDSKGGDCRDLLW